MNKGGSAWVLVVFIFVLIIFLLVLGRYGGKEAQKENNKCVFGVGEEWCLIWETQVYEGDYLISNNSQEINGTLEII